MADVCAVPTCPAAPAWGEMFCAIHAGAKRAAVVMAGTKYTRCQRTIERDDWVTPDSSAAVMTHTSCPPPAPAFSRKKDRPKPLLEAADLEQPF